MSFFENIAYVETSSPVGSEPRRADKGNRSGKITDSAEMPTDPNPSDARVAAAFELAAQLCPIDGLPHDTRSIREKIAALTPPEATAALEKMLLEHAIEEARVWHNYFHDEEDTELHAGNLCCDRFAELQAKLAALTGEKKA